MSIQDEIVAIEQRFWQTLIDRDVTTATALMSDECIVAGAQGTAAIDRASFGDMLAHGQWTLHAYSFSAVNVLQPAPDVAVIGYKVREKLTVDDKPLELEAADTSTWVRQGGEWRCVLHTESVLGDPFGRDRVKG